jgi:DNA/RNA endonuclease YhcR with UshA esterase domain
VKLRVVAEGSLVDSMLQLAIIEGKWISNEQEQKEAVTQNQKFEIKGAINRRIVIDRYARFESLEQQVELKKELLGLEEMLATQQMIQWKDH